MFLCTVLYHVIPYFTTPYHTIPYHTKIYLHQNFPSHFMSFLNFNVFFALENVPAMKEVNRVVACQAHQNMQDNRNYKKNSYFAFYCRLHTALSVNIWRITLKHLISFMPKRMVPRISKVQQILFKPCLFYKI